MRASYAAFASAAIAALLVATLPQPGEARPQYHREFSTRYRDIAAIAKEAKCDVCHCYNGKLRNSWNDYGYTLKKSFGIEKNVKDRAAINKALEAVESLPSHVPDKTFGDLIREGRLPGAPCDVDAKHDACGC